MMSAVPGLAPVEAADEQEGNGIKTTSPIDRSEMLWLAGIVLAYALLAVALIAQGVPFGHDEAAYSLRARDLVQDSPPLFYWGSYRAPGLPFVMQLAWIGPATEPYLRIIVASFGVPMIVSTWMVGRTLLSPRVGLIAAAGVMLVPSVLDSAVRVWPDVPGAAIGMVAIGIYTWSIAQRPVSRWMIAVPLAVFGATMLRFGAPVPIAIGLIGITLWQWRAALASWRLVLLTAILTLAAASVVLFIPGTTAWAQFGEPVSPYLADAGLREASSIQFSQTILGYIRMNRFLIGGLAGTAMLVGVAAGIVVASQQREIRKAFWTALGIAGATALGVALIIHAEPRYLTPMFPWLWIAAGVGLNALVPTGDRRLAVAAAVVASLMIFGSAYGQSTQSNNVDAKRYQRIEDAARIINNETDNGACSVLSSYVPQVAWYSACPTSRINTRKVVVDNPAFPDGPRFLLLVEGGKRQPDGPVLEGYMDATTGLEFTVGDPGSGRRQYVEVYLIGQ